MSGLSVVISPHVCLGEMTSSQVEAAEVSSRTGWGQVARLFGPSTPSIFGEATDASLEVSHQYGSLLTTRTPEEIVAAMDEISPHIDTEYENALIVHHEHHRKYPDEIMSLKDALCNRPPWKTLHSEQLGFLVSLMRREVRGPGDRIFQQAIPAPALIVVIFGEIDLFKSVSQWN